MKREIAIIGFGRFGRFLADVLRRDFRVVAADRRLVKARGVAGVSVREAARRDLVILAVPAGKLPALLREIAPVLRPGTLVCDVSAVKEEPVRWMRELLPPSVEILSLHPLFGPDSAREGIAGHMIVLCPVRLPARRLARVRTYLHSKKLLVRLSTPRAHDRAMASTLFVTQFVGRALRSVVASRPRLTTRNAELLLAIVRATGNDSAELLRDIYRYNRFARRVPASLIKACRALAGNLRNT